MLRFRKDMFSPDAFEWAVSLVDPHFFTCSRVQSTNMAKYPAMSQSQIYLTPHSLPWRLPLLAKSELTIRQRLFVIHFNCVFIAFTARSTMTCLRDNWGSWRLDFQHPGCWLMHRRSAASHWRMLGIHIGYKMPLFKIRAFSAINTTFSPLQGLNNAPRFFCCFFLTLEMVSLRIAPCCTPAFKVDLTPWWVLSENKPKWSSASVES